METGPVRRNRIDALGAATLIGFSLLMGLNQSLVVLVNQGMSPLAQAGLRSAAAILPVLLFANFAGRRLSLSDGTLGPGLVAGLLFSTEFAMLFKALEYTSVGRASIFFYTMPFWVALAAHWLIPGERLTVAKVFGLALALAGVVLALADRSAVPGAEAWIGDLLCLCAAFSWAVLALMMRLTRLSSARPEMQLLYQLGVSALLLTALGAATGPVLREMTPLLWGIFTFQVLVVVSIGFLGWFWVLSVYPAAQMASFGFLAPVFGVAFGWLILGEPVGISLLMALVLVGAGIFLVNWRPGRGQASATVK
ncbi:MAG: DMT family transporter [Pseudomonadota bacterium]